MRPEIIRETGMTQGHRNWYGQCGNHCASHIAMPLFSRRMTNHDHQNRDREQQHRCDAQKIHRMTARNEVARERPDAAPHARGNDKTKILPVFDEKLNDCRRCDEENERDIPDRSMRCDWERAESLAV